MPLPFHSFSWSPNTAWLQNQRVSALSIPSVLWDAETHRLGPRLGCGAGESLRKTFHRISTCRRRVRGLQRLFLPLPTLSRKVSIN